MAPVSLRLSPDRYLAHLDADAERLLAAVRAAPDAPVAACPGWTATDLLVHVAAVYDHKVVALRTLRQPEDGEWPKEPPAGHDAFSWFAAARTTLRALLESRPAESPCWTWWPAEQTAGFWQRRMAQETLVHRWDAQDAAHRAGAGPAPDPLDGPLAADGVDELLGWLAWPWDDVPQEEARGQRVAVATAGVRWVAALRRTSVEVAGPEPEAGPRPEGATAVGGPAGALGWADATLAGEPGPLLLHLWGRGDEGVASAGDPAALGLLRARLALTSG